jgi:hypothetical protein
MARSTLQVEQYLTLAFEQAYRLGVKPVSAEIIESVRAHIFPNYNRLSFSLSDFSTFNFPVAILKSSKTTKDFVLTITEKKAS